MRAGAVWCASAVLTLGVARTATGQEAGAPPLMAREGGIAVTAPASPLPTQAAVMRNGEDRERWMATSVDREYRLRYAGSQAEQNEVLTAVRNMVDPMVKIFMVPSQRTIVVHAPEEAQAQVAKLVQALDQPQPRYRITYTLTEMDGTRKVGVQHYSMVAEAGQHLFVKQGSRVPISLGTATNWQYYDVGVNFDLTLSELQGGALLKSKVEQNSIAPESLASGAGSGTGPLMRQSTLEGTTSLMLGKPLLLGSIDVPSSTRRFDVEAVVETVN